MNDEGDVFIELPLTYIMANWRPGHADRTWDEEEAELRSRICCCCDQPGHYQDILEAKMVAEGGPWWEELQAPVLSSGGKVWDGHHRIIGARRLGWETLLVVALGRKDLMRDAG